MNSSFRSRFAFIAGLCWLALGKTALSADREKSPLAAAVIVETRGQGVEVSRQPGVWDPARTNQALYPGNLLRTDDRSQALVRFSELETVRVAERSSMRVGEISKQKRGFEFLKGLLYFFHRDRPDQFDVRTPQMSAIVRGTEFTLEVTEDGTSILNLLEGEVTLSNQLDQIEIKTGEQGIVTPGQPPRKTSLLEATNTIQWCLYYPAALDLKELDLPVEARQRLSKSLAAYDQGDLVAAFAAYTEGRQMASDAERVFLASLRLAFGQVGAAEELLVSIGTSGEPNTRPAALAKALRLLIAAVKQLPRSPGPGSLSTGTNTSQLATSRLAESYWQQSLSHLPQALASARKATEISPEFAFAWARVAELEFSFGATRSARQAVERSLRLAPKNAQAYALQGFLLAAANRIQDATASFERAIAADPSLANGWLGRGLCRIRLGQGEAGRLDLQIAAMVEPNRALLRSYLGKAFSNAGDANRADKELKLAKALDPRDPTAWLYSSLLHFQENRVNAGIRDLERSQDLNDNRSILRSRLLLDQDRAVGSANLAAIYRDVGMFDVSAREASRAVANDYANYSAHLFLANSYNELRDPNLLNLRYETATFNEYLLANLLSPVGANTLSPYVSQQEYSRLFEKNGPGLSSSTFYSTHGDFQQDVSQYGTWGNFGYALDGTYRTLNGQQPNNDLCQFVFSSSFKEQLTPQDSVYFQAIYSDLHSGDLRQYYNFDNSIPNLPAPSLHLRVKERQDPNLLLGYHHEWTPGIHTLFLAGRLEDKLSLDEPSAVIQTLVKDGAGRVIGTVDPANSQFALDYQNEFEAYTAELQQICQITRHTIVAGGRYQAGWADTRSVLQRDPTLFPPIYDPKYIQSHRTDLDRLNAYAYENWNVMDELWLIGGGSYDRLEYPQNVSSPPTSGNSVEKDQFSPKAGFIWSPDKMTSVRGAYTRSLGGLFYDQSVRLEPSQVAGFNQAFRSLIPESVSGPIPGSSFETFHIGGERKFKSNTYIGLDAELLKSDATQGVGVLEFTEAGVTPNATPATVAQDLSFEEKSLTFNLNQLLGEEWALGARYRLSEAKLDTHYQDIPGTLAPNVSNRAILHQLNLFTIFNHRSGFFAEAQGLWMAQSNQSYHPDLPGDEFWQVNLFAGYRLARRRAELTLGLLNLANQNYRLNPLNPYPELPRHRTLTLAFRLNL